jgi:hypothetical protein
VRFGLLAACAAAAGCFDSAVAVDEGVVACSDDDDCVDDGVCVAGRCFAAGTQAPAITGPFVVELVEDQAARFTLAVNGIDPAALRIDVRSPPARGSLVVLGGAELLYTPAPDDHGSVTVELVASDGGLRQTPPTAIELVVQPVADDAVVVIDDIFTDEDTPVLVEFAIVDPDARDCAIVVIDPGVKGTVDVTGDSLAYNPIDNENGVDRIIVAAECDGDVDAGSQRSVQVTIAAVDDAPIALPLPASQSRLLEDSILPIALPFEEVDGDPVCFVITTPPERGSLDVSALDAGLVVYVPFADENGVDTFTFAIGDRAPDVDSAPCVGQSSQQITLTIEPVDDAPRFVTTAIAVAAVGKNQVVPIALDFPDGDPHGARLVLSASSDDVFAKANVDSSGLALVLSPRPHITTRQSLLRVSVVDDRGLQGRESIEVTINGMPSCGHAKLADPDSSTGLTLLERRRIACTVGDCVETFVSFCEQTRRGGGFELVVKVPGSGAELRRDALAWTSRLLNENNPVPDGGAGVLRGARDLPLDDLLIFQPAEGFTPGAALDVDFDVDPTSPNPTLQARMQAAPATTFIERWARNEAVGILPRVDENLIALVCRSGEQPFSRLELGINQPDARIGGAQVAGCRSATGEPRGPEQRVVLGLGSGGLSSRATRLVFGRSRDFRSIAGDSCEALKERFGSAFIPGLYRVSGLVVACGSVDEDLPRGCNDGAIGPGIEACDDGDDLVANGCSPDCALVFCGDGVVTPPYETCELSGAGTAQACDNTCGSGDPSDIEIVPVTP